MSRIVCTTRFEFCIVVLDSECWYHAKVNIILVTFSTNLLIFYQKLSEI